MQKYQIKAFPPPAGKKSFQHVEKKPYLCILIKQEY